MSGSDADDDPAHGTHSDKTSEEALSDELSDDEGSGSEDQAERGQQPGALSGVALWQQPVQRSLCLEHGASRRVGGSACCRTVWWRATSATDPARISEISR
jgi:hypothetical protein